MSTWKRLLSLLLVMVILTSLLPPVNTSAVTVVEKADTNWPEQKTSIYYVQKDPEELQKKSTSEYLSLDEAAVAARQDLVDRKEVITLDVVSELHPNVFIYDVIEDALAHTGNPQEGDYLNKQWAEWSCSYSYYTGEDGYYTSLEYTFTYYTTAEQEAQVDVAVQELLAELNVEGESDYQKVKTIYDWLCANVTYDYDNLEDDAYLLKYSAYAALIDRTAVCQGYALLFYRLALEMGVDARLISGIGNGGRHAWNIVELENNYYNLDATWDAGCSQYSYFLKADDTFIDHTRDSEFATADFYAAYPMSTVDYKASSGSCTDGHTYVDGVCTVCGETQPVDPAKLIEIVNAAYALEEGASMPDQATLTGVITSIDAAYSAIYRYITVTIKVAGAEDKPIMCYRLKGDDIATLNVNDIITVTGTLKNYKGIIEFDAGCTLDAVAQVDPPVAPDNSATYIFSDYDAGEQYAQNEEHVLDEIVTVISDDAYFSTELRLFDTTDYDGTAIIRSAKVINSLTLNVGFEKATLNVYGSADGETWTLITAISTICNYDNYTVEVPEDTAYTYIKLDADASYQLRIAKMTILFGADGAASETSEGLEYTLSDDGTYYIVSGIGECTDTDLVIPSTYEGLPVAAIGGWAFQNCSDLTSVTISAGITTIGESAFDGCSALTTVAIPASLTVIGDRAFKDCGALTTVIYCGNNYFSINVDMGNYNNPLWSAKVEYHKFEGGHCAICGSEYLGQGTCGENLTWTLTPDGLLTISGTGAMEWEGNDVPWKYCEKDKITAVVIEEGVTTIGTRAFSYCTNLLSVTVPSGIITIGDYAFDSCYELKSFNIPDGVQSIGVGAFSGCMDATGHLVIPDSVTSLGDEAFRSCRSLTGLTIGSGITVIGRDTFGGCSGITEVTIPDGVTTIGEYAFQVCGFTQVVIPASVTSIAGNAFSNCENLTAFVVDEENTVYSTDEQGILYNKDKTVLVTAPCKISSCIVPDSVITIGDYAFGHCPNLTELTIGNKVVTIGAYAFWLCGMTEIHIPDSVTTIGDQAFAACHNLTSAILGNGVTVVGNFAFGNAPLTLLRLPGSIATIGSEAFRDSLTAVIYCGTPEQWTQIENYTREYIFSNTLQFHDFQNGACIYCSAADEVETEGTCGDNLTWSFADGVLTISGTGDMWDYEWINDQTNSTPWSKLVITEVRIEQGVTSIGARAFEGCTGLTAVTIPSSVTSIGNDAFSNCVGLTAITIPESVVTIGKFAFSYCTGLTEVVIPDSVTSVGEQAFRECYGLTKLTIGKGITQIASYMFAYCKNLTSVSIPDGITNIEYGAFQGCEALTTVRFPASVTNIGYESFKNCSSLTTVIYCGTPEQWENIWIMTYNNGFLLNADRQYHDFQDGVCIYCGLAGGNHEWVEATCTAPKTCAICGATEGEALGHTYESVVTAPTCTEGGYTTYTCSVCGDSYVGDETEALGHTYESVVTEPTCTEGGYTTYTCSVCGDSYVGDETEALGHNYVDDVCSVCGAERGVASEGLAYTLSDDGTYYIVSGIGTCTDSDLVIPTTYNGLPVTEIGESAFQSCSSLRSVVLPRNLTIIGDWAFAYTKLEVVELPSGVTYIGRCAFNLTNLSRIHIPASVAEISVLAFYQCSDLAQITVDGDNPVYCAVDGVLYTKDMSTLLIYPDGKPDETFVVPATVVTIGEDAFRRADFSSVILPEGLISIGSHAFYGCRNLTGITIPSTVTELGSNVFMGNQLTEIVVSEGNAVYCTVDGVLYSKDQTVLIFYPANRPGATFEIPSGVLTIGDNAFEGCGVLTSIIIPDGVTRIGNSAFQECWSLVEITIADSVVSIGRYAFRGCALKTIKLPAKLTTIERELFLDCYDLTTVVIPVSVTKICRRAFFGTSNLTEIHYLGTEEQWNAITKEEDWNALDWDGNIGNFTIIVEVINILYGDANGDGTVNGKDLMLLRKYMANYNFSTGESTVAVEAGADANGDGTINGKDLMLLRKYMANYNFSTGESTVVLGPTG